MAARRHRLFSRVVRKTFRGTRTATKLAFWASVYSVLFPIIILVMLSGKRPEGAEETEARE